MDRFFDADNPLMQFLSRAVDLAVLNLLTLLFSLPVVTAGASLSAMNYVLLRIRRGEETYIWKMFLKAFRENLRQGSLLGLVYLIFAAVAGADLLILRSVGSRRATGMMFFLTFLSLIVLVSAVYTFALQARFANTIRGTLLNAWKLLVGYPLRTVGILAVWILWAVILVLGNQGMVFLYVLYGLSVPGQLCTILYDPIFRKLEREAEG